MPMDYVVRTAENTDWITAVLIFCLLLYTVAKYVYPKRFQEFTLLPVTNKYFMVLGKGDELKHPFNILLFIPQVLAVSLFILLFLKTQGTVIEQPIPLFIQVCCLYGVFVLAKFIIEKLVGVIFNLDKIINKYLYEKMSYRNLIGVFVFVGNLIFFYVYPPSVNLLIVFIAVVVILNAITLFYSYKTNSRLIFSEFFYFILYLCALEISPYIILYKAIV